MYEWCTQATWMAEHGHISQKEAQRRLDRYFDCLECVLDRNTRMRCINETARPIRTAFVNKY